MFPDSRLGLSADTHPSKKRPECPRKMTESKVIQHINRVCANNGFICAHVDVRRHTVPPERHKSGVSITSTWPFRRPSPSKERPECPRKITESKVIQHINRVRERMGSFARTWKLKDIPSRQNGTNRVFPESRLGLSAYPHPSKERPECPRKLT
jgi:hypothetical protein